jgi:photosystem II stability/assembly factor-like uncharacterized protein
MGSRTNKFFLLIVLVISFAYTGCKKDLLHLSKVTRLDSHTTDALYRIKFMGDNTCIIGGGDTYNRAIIVTSHDGGYTWESASYPQAGKAMFALGVSPAGGMYMCGVDGTVLYSTDTGKNWKNARILNWEVYTGAAYPTNDTGVYVSTILQRGGSIVQVDSNFNIINELAFQFGLNNVYTPNASTGYVVGYGAVMKTTDHRHTWNFQDVQGDNFTAMDIHGDEIWMCGANGGIFHTTNGGDHWDCLRNGNNVALPRYWLRSILFRDRQHGWAVGDDGRLIYSDDGGHHWMEYDKFTTDNLRSIVLCPNGDLLVAGDNGALYRVAP